MCCHDDDDKQGSTCPACFVAWLAWVSGVVRQGLGKKKKMPKERKTAPKRKRENGK